MDDFENVIYLNLEHYPDCQKCNDPTKKEVGRMIDAEGPGVVSIVYGCENKSCKMKKQFLDNLIVRNDMEGQKNG